ncbi:MAG: hypothetical protein ACKV22_22060 [Bryobacteraceae bacterium]
MFSLRKHITQIDDLESLFRQLLACYQEAISGFAKHLPASPKSLFEEPRSQLKAIKSGLGSHPNRGNIEAAREELDRLLKAFGRHLDDYLKQQEKDTKEVMAIIARLTESLARRDTQHSVRFHGITRKLRLLATGQDLEVIKRGLSEEVTQLERYIEDMDRENREAVERLRDDLGTKLEDASPFSRRQAEELIRSKIREVNVPW